MGRRPGEAVIVGYAFLTSALLPPGTTGVDISEPFAPLNDAQIAAAEQAMASWAAVANVTFVETSAADADITFGGANLGDGIAGFGGFPSTEASGEVWISTTDETLDAPVAGDYAFQVFVSVVGYALGLKSAIAWDPTSGEPLPDIPVEYENDREHTILSLFKDTEAEDEPQGPMLYDIAAVQHLYSANTATNAGDTTYDFGADGHPFMVLWDGGGHDTIDLSGRTAATDIDLRPGYFTNSEGPYNFVIAYSTAIEDVIGSGHDDRIAGNDGTNALSGEGGADLLDGNDGNDRLAGGDDNDTLYGELGNDAISGGVGDDSLIGGPGNDRLSGGEGSDTAWGGDGNDRIASGGGDDRLFGNAGRDMILGGTGDDEAWGGADNDRLAGGAGNDGLHGGSGKDVLNGGDGNDLLSGGADGDRLVGGAGSDTLSGGDGADGLIGGTGDDTVTGGACHDTIAGGLGADVLMGGAGNDWLDGGENDDRISAGADTAASGGDDIVSGGTGSDTLSGGDGADTLAGGAGDDLLLAGDGADAYLGGAGFDTLDFSAGDDVGEIEDIDGLDDIDPVDELDLTDESEPDDAEIDWRAPEFSEEAATGKLLYGPLDDAFGGTVYQGAWLFGITSMSPVPGFAAYTLIISSPMMIVQRGLFPRRF